jgi:hypothetical protein
MSDLMKYPNFARTYLDDLEVISCSIFEDHLEKSECVLKILFYKALCVNAEKSAFCCDKIVDLEYWFSWSGMQPIPKKVEAG